MKRGEFLIWTLVVVTAAATWTMVALWYGVTMWGFRNNPLKPGAPPGPLWSIWSRTLCVMLGDVFAYPVGLALGFYWWHQEALCKYRRGVERQRQQKIDDLERELKIGSHR